MAPNAVRPANEVESSLWAAGDHTTKDAEIVAEDKKKLKKGMEDGLGGISQVIVQCYKSLARPQRYAIPVRPLTLLAGANSSGKSSAIQPLLLLKQTLEASFDPGPLLLHGPHVRFTATHQIFPTTVPFDTGRELAIGMAAENGGDLTSFFSAKSDNEIDITRMVYHGATGETWELKEPLAGARVKKLLPDIEGLIRSLQDKHQTNVTLKVRRRRCFFELVIEELGSVFRLMDSPTYDFEQLIREIIHVQGLRGNPERFYQTTAVGSMFPGTFESYVASIIHEWQQKSSESLKDLWSDLERLGLSWKVQAKRVDASQVEIRVGRLPRAKRSGARDLVNIADVGFGVSQALPIVVALRTAKPGQLVYLEQPEIHLHPKAHIALAEILVNAAIRGVRVVAETHSALLILAIQALVAEKVLAPDKVALHWFHRNDKGVTEISTAELDEKGAYGTWPEDFGEVELTTQSRYMNAVESQLFRAVGG